MSRRGTTPTHIFKTTVDLTNAQALYLTYKQGETVRIEKTLEDVTIEPLDENKNDHGTYQSLIRVNLTQADTLALKASEFVDIQARVKFPNEKALASDILNIPVRGILKEGII